MELTLKRLLEDAEFKKYRGKGYDPAEVDDFLDRAASMAGKVEVQLTQALQQAKGGGGPSESEIAAEVDRRVEARLAERPPEPGPSDEDRAEEAARTLMLAQRTADAAVKEAREEAEARLAEARSQAEQLVADAEARAAALDAESRQRAETARAELEAEITDDRREARQRLAAEIGELEGAREALRSDVNVLERHVEEQRIQLGSTLAELQRLLDDPGGFRLAPAPALVEPELPDFSDLDAPEPEDAAPAAPEPDAAAPDATTEPPGSDAPAAPEPEAAAPEAAAEPPAPAAEPESEPAPEPEAPAAPADPPPVTFQEVDHAAPGLDEVDLGPPTAPVQAVDLDDGGDEPEEDPFLAELRKAMVDDEPLGPRDEAADSRPASLFGDDDDRRGWRFGRRR